MTALLHLVVATLREPAEPAAFEGTLAQARALAGAPGVRGQIVGWSGQQLVIGTVLESAADLDRFVASPEHMRFVMQGLALVIRGMWSTAIETDAAPAIEGGSRLWAFGLPDQEGVYEWQVREFLDAISAIGRAAIVGVTIEERERYRAGGLVALDHDDGVDRALAAARRNWLEAGGAVDEALVEAHEV